ncbi:hypothetical protein N177_0660 [Lutibaculum baratangense AMV1]|uniref:histidine kinase n=1 Tax=Lutibaculum baratangense AMV1 TaxID=631454 RepID=V4RLI0_9HYPH|nr:hypothetical protein N177_0660 [Lutibaculum baratangense AMV1]
MFVAWPLWVVAYVALDYVSFIESYRGLAITPWNPTAGLAVALVFLGGWRHAPVVIVSPVLAGVLVRGGTVPVPIHLVEGLLFGGSYLVAGLVARHVLKLSPRLQSPGATIRLMLLAVGGSALAAFSYILVLGLADILRGGEILEAFLYFFVGDLIGILIFFPATLIVLTRQWRPLMTWEILPQGLAIAAAFAAIFAVPHAREYQLFYLLFLPLLWCSFRSGIVGAVAALFVVQVGLIVAVHLRGGLLLELVSFQMLMISLAGTGLVFGSLIDQQRIAASRLRQQQLALGRALRMRSVGEVATAIAHEVNQPITSIRTYAGLARDALAAERKDDAMNAVLRIRSECDRASSIIRSTRELVRQEIARPCPVEMEKLIVEVRDLLVDRLGHVSLAIEVAPEARTVTCDPAQVKQALYNLVDNALDAIDSDGARGTILIRVTVPDPQTVEIAVRDTGPGFPEDFAASGITPLVSTKPEGTGIGLSIARSVAETHGGSLLIESDVSGATVRLRLAAQPEKSRE